MRVLGKLIVAKGLKNLPKVEKIAQSGHTGHLAQSVTSKKLPKNDFNRKIKYFDTFTRIALECIRFGQINWVQRL